jgi:hypothetical protein
MAADRCGLGSLLPTSCRGRAETFARRLSNRLRSLGTAADDATPTTNDTGTQPQPTTDDEFWRRRGADDEDAKDVALVASPPESSTDRFYDFDVVDQTSGTSSPANEVKFFL